MKTKLIVLLIGAIFSLTGCEKYLDINTDPSNPQVGEAQILLPPVFSQMERGVQFDARYLGRYIQNWGLSTSNDRWEQHGWLANSDAQGEIWRSHYYGIGKNIDLIIADANATEQFNYAGVAKAIRAWSWQTTTDYHGEAILKQAFDDSRYVFDYDTQPEIYAEVVRLANEAIAELSKTGGKGSPSKLAVGDIVYKGDPSKWIKFSYGLLARNLHNLSNKSSYNPDKVIEFADKALQSNADNFIIPNGGLNTTDGNFFGPIRNNLAAYRQSSIIVSLMDGTVFSGVKDPRITRMLAVSADGTIRGVGPAKGDPNRLNATTRIPNPWGEGIVNPGPGKGKYIFRDNAGFPIMTYSEIQFIKAEALFRKGDKTAALTAYKNGVSAHIDFVNSNVTSGITPISGAEKAAYMASAAIPATGTTLTLDMIMHQKFIALWAHAFVETWSDLRRFNYNEGDVKGNNPYLSIFAYPTPFWVDNNNKPIYRVRPRFNSEYVWNMEALSKIGGDKSDYHTVKMWFSQP
ncbi:MAG: SusD/RagB family nutrient-binding outer membrane lipoprotein [Pedobacter sp.]|nr:SusD/RagB family nutrient-binding outer membrane lipoprotein [Pedobacter sp.]